MLDNNTNKVIWVGVAIGVVVVIGVGALALFPEVTDEFKPMMRESMLVTQATPEALKYGPEKNLTYADNRDDSWNGYSYFLANKAYTIKPHTYVYYHLNLKVNKSSQMFIDVSNFPKSGDAGNDFDDLSYRKMTIADSNGNVISQDDKWRSVSAKLKDGETYTVDVKLYNYRNVNLYDDPEAGDGFHKGTKLVFRPDSGYKNGVDLHVSSWNYKVNMVHF